MPKLLTKLKIRTLYLAITSLVSTAKSSHLFLQSSQTHDGHNSNDNRNVVIIITIITGN